MIEIAARLWFAFIPALLASCAVVERGSPAPGGATNTQQSPLEQSAPCIRSIENATYTGIYDQPITLDNGRWQGEPFIAGGASRPTAGLAADFCLNSDINGDGLAEAIVILWENSGGTGSYSYVAVVGWQNGETRNLGTAQIGDRVQIRDARIDGQHIVLSVVQQGPDDAACCPSQKATRSWSMTPLGLQEGDAAIDGILSTVDLEETSWRLVRLSHSEPALQSAPVTLLIDGNRLSGQGPCNRYFARIRPGDFHGALTISQAGATRMNCSIDRMQFEQNYFQALAGVNRYSFSMGRLALGWVYEDEFNTMLFEREQQR